MVPSPQAAASSTPPPAPTSTLPPLAASISVDAAAQGMPINPLILGSNLPAWLNPQKFADPQFRARTAASGITLLRIPGGSWGDDYGWLSCETKQNIPGAYPCNYPWASRPTDFINFFRAVEQIRAQWGWKSSSARIEPMYIVNVNYTAQEAAALVAFFNAKVGDTRAIGKDLNGTDWKTAGDWASLRAAGGNEQPLGIRYWEIGNEIYGGKTGPKGCGANGWEVSWTCDGGEYMLGIPGMPGIPGKDGFLKMRAAMKKVDPSIKVGAVGGTTLGGNQFSDPLFKEGKGSIDYIVLHTYPNYTYYNNPRKEWNEILALPLTHWLWMAEDIRIAMDNYNDGKSIPVAMNEYDIIPAYGKEDYRNYMNKYLDALFMTDSIGQMIQNGFTIVANWDLMNGKSNDYGNEFGLMRADETNYRQPKYWSFPIWSRFGTQMLPAQSSAKPDSELSVYAGKLADGTITLIVINKRGGTVQASIRLDGVQKISGGTVDSVAAPSPDSLTATFNGVEDPKDDLSDAPPKALEASPNNEMEYTFAPYTITLFRLQGK